MISPRRTRSSSRLAQRSNGAAEIAAQEATPNHPQGSSDTQYPRRSQRTRAKSNPEQVQRARTTSLVVQARATPTTQPPAQSLGGSTPPHSSTEPSSPSQGTATVEPTAGPGSPRSELTAAPINPTTPKGTKGPLISYSASKLSGYHKCSSETLGTLTTPMAKTTQDATQIPKLDEQKKLIRAEIGEPENVPATEMAHILKQYRRVATDAEFRSYFAKTAFYKQGAWKMPREDGMKENQLYGPTQEIIDDIMSHFHQSADRKAFVSSGKRLFHQENPETDHYSSPDVIIQGNGPSFEYPHRASDADPSLGFSNTAACIEMKLDKDMGLTLAGHVPQVGIYSRQIFIQQPNRRFVRSLVLSENHAGLIHFDRSGAQYTDLININEKPRDFIRLILGISSLDEHLLGFDTSIQWAMGPDGRKESGTLTTKDAAGHEVEYDLVVPYPIFNRRSIRGRGTICWAIRDSDGNEFLVKDSWRSEGRQSETTFLEKAQGLQGVVQMLSCEENREETASFRGPMTNAVSAAQNFHNRCSMRVVLQCYGPPIIHFTSRKHAISALRDAIAGHRNLIHHERRILHRDISIFNILLGNPGVSKGLRGFLIDLDMAIFWDRPPSEILADCRTGTRLFQSIFVLRSFETKMTPVHDYLDDIESFFYVLCYLMLCFNGAGEYTKAILSAEVKKWDSDDPTVAANQKWTFVSWPLAEDCVPSYWEDPCVSLLEDFKEFIEGIVKAKTKIFAARITDKEKREKIENLHGKINEHYKKVLDLFDKAIEMLPDYDPVVEGTEATDATLAGPPDGSPLPTPSRPPKSTAKASAIRVPVPKRSSQEIEEPEEPQVKHLRTRRSMRSKRGAAKPSPLAQSQSESAAQ